MSAADWRAGAPGVLVTGSVWSQSRPATVNVIMSSPGDVAGNNVYRRPAGPVVDVVRRLVGETFAELRATLAQRYPDAVVTVRADHTYRGRYHYTIWSHPLTVD